MGKGCLVSFYVFERVSQKSNLHYCNKVPIILKIKRKKHIIIHNPLIQVYDCKADIL